MTRARRFRISVISRSTSKAFRMPPPWGRWRSPTEDALERNKRCERTRDCEYLLSNFLGSPSSY